MPHNTSSNKKIAKKASVSQGQKRQACPSSSLKWVKKMSSKPLNIKNMEYKVVKMKNKLPSSTTIQNNKAAIIKKEYEERVNKIREKQLAILQRYSSPKTKEIYVNPNRHKCYKIQKRPESETKTSSNFEEVIRNILPSSKDIPLCTSQATPPSAVKDESLSPLKDMPLFPVKDRPLSPIKDRPISPVKDRPLSPVKDRPPSSVKDIPPASVINRSPICLKDRPPSSTKSGAKSTETPDIVKAAFAKAAKNQDATADEILLEAHRLIWLWLFNGLFPRNLQKKTVIKH